MSDFVKNEEDNWQKEVRGKIDDLVIASEHAKSKFNSWALDFIDSISEKLDREIIHVTPKQYEKICDLWDKI